MSHISDTSSRPGTALSMSSSNGHLRRAVSTATLQQDDEDEEEPLRDEFVTEMLDTTDPEARFNAIRLAVQQSFASIQSRFAIVLENAETLSTASTAVPSPSTASYPSSSSRSTSNSTLPTTSILPDSPPPSVENTPSQDQLDEGTPAAFGFKPKPLQLSPPATPESDALGPAGQFVTTRTKHERRPSADRRPFGHHHRGASSIATIASFHDVPEEEQTPTIDRSFDSPRKTRSNSFGVPVVVDSSFSRQSNYDDDSQSFVSFDEDADTSSALGHDSDDDDGTGRHSETSDRPDSPVDAPVELFTRTSSALGRRMGHARGPSTASKGGLGAPVASRLPRPVSNVTIRQDRP